MLARAADACFAEGLALLDEGSPGTAYHLLALAARLRSSNPEFQYQAARAASALGHRDRIVRYCERTLGLDHSNVAARKLLADTFLHGEAYQLVLERIHRHLKPRTYVEIGVETGHTLRLAGLETLALGIDPEPVIAFPLSANVRVFRET